MGGMRAPERLGSCLRQVDVAHPAGVDHLRPSVDADEGVVRGAQRAELDAEHHTVAVPAP